MLGEADQHYSNSWPIVLSGFVPLQTMGPIGLASSIRFSGIAMTQTTYLTEPVGPRMISRRTVLGMMTGSALLLSPLSAWCSPSAGTRSLSFIHTHTGEKLSLDYWCDGAFQTQCLAPLNHFLRDFRTGEAANMDAGLLDILYNLQALTDRDAVYEVISGYRSPQTNAMLRKSSSEVAKKSLHMEGKAVDIRVTGFSSKKLQQLALANQSGGVGFYAKSDFVHLDTGRVRSWVG
jgi:uncharacterized protein YcbK (DUF882 family)